MTVYLVCEPYEDFFDAGSIWDLYADPIIYATRKQAEADVATLNQQYKDEGKDYVAWIREVEVIPPPSRPTKEQSAKSDG